ncbi:butyrate kinase [Lactobacillus gigeriorum]|uniref:Probable butyrate kinase n=1 Tax=Lactobacillus gigeriorum DSM 23908 = CRBIP 24.85 TaxID=1423751 RepID=I7LD39_9LACO|nr:butyrate kinase [Lactobacillus gigeriorum]KRN09989.1 butyrate kinase [Lactobacillus gigeriorum DSM 23908 = CRBIP 24.85]CCI87016.1 Probable butyrate kinase [Lactobacillus gigeriorum DSM 23908 = CRBIP 24.85]
MKTVVAINPGATSTKVAVYQDENLLWKEELIYESSDLEKYDKIFDQFELRLKDIEKLLDEHNITHIDTAVGRGGLIGPVQPGAILVNEPLINHLEFHPMLEHASNLGAKLAKAVSEKYGDGRAYVYDPVTVDSMKPVSRLTGLKQISRISIAHHLNMRAVARKASEDLGKDYKDLNIVVAHIGGGASASAHEHGEVIDIVSDDEMMFGANRSGGLPIKMIVPYIKEIGIDEFYKIARHKAGLVSYFGTTDLRVVQQKIEAGDEEAALVFDALCLGISKTIAALSVSINGPIDVICLTGGMARSEKLVENVAKRTGFIAPLRTYPGEFELEALALGGLRVINGEETAQILTYEDEN